MKKGSVLDFESLLDKASREYLIEGGNEFLFEVRKKKDHDDFYERLDQELAQQKYLKIKSFRSVKEGKVHMPRPSLLSLQLTDLLNLRPELREIKKTLDQAESLSRHIEFKDFLQKHYTSVIGAVGILCPCLEVFNFLTTNREAVAGLLSRQVPHGQSTKIVGKEFLLLLIYRFSLQEPSLSWDDFYQDFKILGENSEFRFYAPRALWRGEEVREIHGVLAREWDQPWEFPLKGTILVENYQSFLSLVPKVHNHLLVWGQGWKAAQVFTVKAHFPSPLYYWGDIDREGLEILNVVASKSQEKVEPLLMDMETFLKHKHIAQRLNRKATSVKNLTLLPEVYEQVCRENLRIEQEQVEWPNQWDF